MLKIVILKEEANSNSGYFGSGRKFRLTVKVLIEGLLSTGEVTFSVIHF